MPDGKANKNKKNSNTFKAAHDSALASSGQFELVFLLRRHFNVQ
jgi:hypothetical protein